MLKQEAWFIVYFFVFFSVLFSAPKAAYNNLFNFIYFGVRSNKKYKCSGRRIVDIGYVFDQIKSCVHKGGCGCTFINMQLTGEINYGLRSVFTFICEVCNVCTKIESDNKQMVIAGNEERRLALENESIDTDGIPMCTVVADGQWSKRSYKTKYDALSGVVRNSNIQV